MSGSGDTAQQLLRMLNEMKENFAQEMATLRESQTSAQEANREQIRALQENIATLGAAVSTPASEEASPPYGQTNSDPSITPARQAKKKPTLPDPVRFDGNRKEFPSWLLEMQNKLETDGTAIGHSKDQFAYIFSRLEKGARSMATTFAQNGGSGGTFDPGAFLTYLNSCYGDPN